MVCSRMETTSTCTAQQCDSTCGSIAAVADGGLALRCGKGFNMSERPNKIDVKKRTEKAVQKKGAHTQCTWTHVVHKLLAVQCASPHHVQVDFGKLQHISCKGNPTPGVRPDNICFGTWKLLAFSPHGAHPDVPSQPQASNRIHIPP